MKLFELESDEDIADALMNAMEIETGKTIFTLRVLRDSSNTIDVIIVFEDKALLLGEISIENVGGKMAARMKGNFV